MNPIDYIVSYCNSISSFFYSIYLEVYSWITPFWYAATFFYSLSTLFSDIAWSFYYFSLWVDDVSTKIAQIISLDNIYIYFKSYFDYAIYAYNWVFNSWINVTSIIDSWWYDAQQTVLALITALATWTTAEFNNVREWVLTLIADIETITPDLLNSVKTFLLSVISDLELWTVTEFNNVRDWALVLWADTEEWTLWQINAIREAILGMWGDLTTWTLTQVDNVKTALLTIISDVELWTVTELNNIKEMIGAVLPWDDILALIISWGALPGAAVQDLINSTLQSWFPFYDDLVSLWNSIVTFFTDPWDWLYDRFDDFIERFW